MSEKAIRLAIVVTHPIQYYVPLYRALSKCGFFELTVFYASRIGIKRFHDKKMGVELQWKIDLLSGYRSVFLTDSDRIDALSFRGVNNRGVGRALAAFKPDVVLIHGYAVLTVLKALFWARSNGVPSILASDSSTHASNVRWRLVVKNILLPLLLRQYSAFLTMSDRSEKYLQKFCVPLKSMFRVPMVIDQTFWKMRGRRREERRSVHSALGMHGNELAVVYVGKLYPGKRVSDLIEALACIRLESVTRPPLRLIVVGDGEQRGELERLASAKNVPASFVGFINIDELPRYFAAADVLVHPAELEQYGMVAVEGAVVGIPLIISDRVGAVGPTSIARPDENAIVYPCANVEALADAIRRLVDDESLRTRMGEASLRISAEHDGRRSVLGVVAAVRYCNVAIPNRSGERAAEISKNLERS